MEGQALQDQTIWFGNGPEYPHHTITNIVPFITFPTDFEIPTHEGIVHLQDGSYIVYKYPDDDFWFVVERKIGVKKSSEE